MLRIFLSVFLLSFTLLADLAPSERINAKLLEYAQNAYENEQWVEAYNGFLRVERTSENLPIIHYYLGRCSYEMGMYEQAEEHYKTVLRLKPEHPSASFELARVHLKYARRHENNARELFATISPSALNGEAREVVSDYSGFSRLPHSHKIKGVAALYGVVDTNGADQPQLVNSRFLLPDPTPSTNPKRDGTKAALATITINHAYQENKECGFRWENDIEGDYLGYTGSDFEDYKTTRMHFATRLAFRVYERYWFAPEYFVDKTSFFDGDHKIDRTGWALGVWGTLENDSKAWAKLALYNHTYKSQGTHNNKALRATVGYKHMVGLHYAQMELAVDHMYDHEKEDDELGLYSQNEFKALWSQFFTTKAQGKLGFEYFMTDFKNANGQKRDDRVFAPFLQLDLALNKKWTIDYLVKMASIDSDEPKGSYSRNIVRLGMRYNF